MILPLTTVDLVVEAIVKMVVRGAPLIGVTGAYGVLVALRQYADEQDFQKATYRIYHDPGHPSRVQVWVLD